MGSSCTYIPRGPIYTTIMELGPQNHSGDGRLGPNSGIVVYMDPRDFSSPLRIPTLTSIRGTRVSVSELMTPAHHYYRAVGLPKVQGVWGLGFGVYTTVPGLFSGLSTPIETWMNR